MRKAERRDADLLFQWVNEDLVRQNSFSTKEILYSEHIRWYEGILKRNDIKQYIYMVDNVPVGGVRITVTGEQAEIGYSICVENRCMGYGKEMLALLQKTVKEDFPQIKKLIAKVKPENVASQKTLEDVGYEKKYDVFEIEVDKVVECQEAIVSGGVLFLTNNPIALELYEWLEKCCVIYLYSERLFLQQVQKLRPYFIISFNYKYFIDEDVIQYMKGNIINLHISYLPWNRGASPNIWSFIDNTPKGVTIHQVDSGFDTGKILYQERCFFDIEKESFASAYQKLNHTIIELFKEKWEEIRSHQYMLSNQAKGGSCHTKKDLEELKSKIEFNWNENVKEFLIRYKKMQK